MKAQQRTMTATHTGNDRESQIEERDRERGESRLERLDRNTVELVNELRVAGNGVQVMLAFLLVVPFNNRFTRLTAFDRYDYFVTLLCIAIAAALLIAPSVHHRLLFRQGEKAYLVSLGTKLAIAASIFIAVGLTGILVLISDVMFGGLTALVVGALGAMFVAMLWFAVPLRHLRRGRLQGD